MKAPSDQELEVAIMWLENNEGEERFDCQNVANWLQTFIAKRTEDRMVRQIVKETGFSAAKSRRALRNSAR